MKNNLEGHYVFFDGDYVPEKIEPLQKLLNQKLGKQFEQAFECYAEPDGMRLKFGVQWINKYLIEHDYDDIWMYKDEVYSEVEAKALMEQSWDTEFEPLILSEEEFMIVQEALPDESVAYFHYYDKK